MSELDDVIALGTALIAEQDKLTARVEAHEMKTDAKLSAHDEHFAVIDQWEQTFENQIEVFRNGIREGFQNLRRELMNGKSRRT